MIDIISAVTSGSVCITGMSGVIWALVRDGGAPATTTDTYLVLGRTAPTAGTGVVQMCVACRERVATDLIVSRRRLDGLPEWLCPACNPLVDAQAVGHDCDQCGRAPAVRVLATPISDHPGCRPLVACQACYDEAREVAA